MPIQRFASSVGVVVNGPTQIRQSSSHRSHLSVLDEDNFYATTRIRASWPARVALLRLLEEDVRQVEVRAVWGKYLTFCGDKFYVRTDQWAVPNMWLSWGLFFMQAFAVLGCIDMNHLNSLQTGVSVLVFLGITLMLYVMHQRVQRPYQICKTLSALIDRVNADIPTRLYKARSCLDEQKD